MCRWSGSLRVSIDVIEYPNQVVEEKVSFRLHVPVPVNHGGHQGKKLR